MRSMARQTSRRAARRGGIQPRPAAPSLGVRARGTKGQTSCPTCSDALARFGSGNLNIYSEAYTGGSDPFEAYAELENLTYEEILDRAKLPGKEGRAAKQMKKLIEEQKRLGGQGYVR